MNIARHLPEVALTHPGELAVAVQQPHAGGTAARYLEYTLHDLNVECDLLAWGLQSLGITRGTRTVLMVKPSLEFFALTFALFKVGAVPVLVDPGIGLKNLKQCLREAEPEAFIGITKAHIARLLFGWGRPTVRKLVTVGMKGPWGGIGLAQLRKGEDKPFPMAEVDAEDTAAILFTSGSTGVPKGAVYSHRVFNAQVEILRNDYQIQPGERDLATFPLFALFGPALGMAAIVPDMDASKPAAADPRKIVAAVEKYQATNMFGSPALLDVVGRYAEQHEAKLPSLRRVISAGAPADLPSLQRFSKLLAEGVEVLPSYGATEALPVAFIGTNELLETAPLTAQGAGVCVGRPVSGVNVFVMRISDEPVAEWSDSLCVPQGETGEIVVQGPVVTPAYYNRASSTALAKMRDEAGNVYHRMGDLGYFDGTGRLWMCGRKSHRVVTGTGTLFTIPCERIFNTHPAVRRTALVGARKHGKIIPVLCVEREKTATLDDASIRKALLETGTQHEVTKSIREILFHPAFPVDIRHNAKIFREKLAVWAEGQLQ